MDENSDSDEYIDLSTCMNDDLNKIYQFNLTDEKLSIKYIGKSSVIPEIIIVENFGPDLNMSLYSCVYSYNELISINNNEFKNNNKDNDDNDNDDKDNDDNDDNDNNKDNNDTDNDKDENDNDDKDDEEQDLKYSTFFFPIVKLVKNKTDNCVISCIVVKLNQDIEFDKDINDWDLYFIENSSLNKEYIKTKKIEKNINSTNIIESIVKLSL